MSTYEQRLREGLSHRRVAALAAAIICVELLAVSPVHGQTGWQVDGTTVYTASGTKVGIGTAMPTVRLDASAQGSSGSFSILNGVTTEGHYVFKSSYAATPIGNGFSFYNETKVNPAIEPSRVFNAMASIAHIPSSNSTYMGASTIRGAQFRGQHTGTGLLGGAIGVSGLAVNESSGSIASAEASNFYIWNLNTTGAMVRAYGVRIMDVNNAGTIQNAYGVYVGRMNGGVQINVPYSFYASDANAYSYFAGNVGIGTTAPQHKLAVNGTIKTKEVIVTNSGWADHVFRADYRLRDLREVDAFIKKYGRLPDIPSEQTVREKGVGIGKMQVKLLAKIEELTLHMINTDERNRRLEVQNRELQKRITRLEALLVKTR